MTDVATLLGDESQMKLIQFQLTSKGRLDRIYISEGLFLQVSSYVVEPVFYRDHCFVEVLVGRRRIQKGEFNLDLCKPSITLLREELFVLQTTEM